MSKIRGLTQIQPQSIDTTLFVANLNLATAQLAEGSKFLKHDGTVALTAALNANSQKITGLAEPTAATDAATKNYVDAAIQGLNIKKSVRVRTNNPSIDITTPGSNVDGIVMVNGDRVLVDTGDNRSGIYVWNGSGSTPMTRASDADTAAELRSAFVFVEEGTSANTGWVQTTDSITLGTTSLVWTQFSSAGQVVGGAGLLLTGNTLDIGAGNGIQVNADSVQVKLDTNPGLTASGTGLKVALSGSSLAVDATGLKINSLSGLALTGVNLAGANLTNGQILVGNASSLATAVTVSGDVTFSNTGVATVASTFLKKADHVAREVPTGTIDGTNKAFTCSATPVANTETVWVNGLMQIPTTDYTLSGSTITFVSAPTVGDVVLVGYIK